MAELLTKPKLDSEFLAKAVIKLMKQDIFGRFKQTGTLSDDDQEFCDKIDWYPVDELELKEEYVKKLKRISKEKPSGKSMDADEFNKWCDEL